MKMDELMASEQEYQEMLTRWDREDKAREERMKELDELDQLTAKAKEMRKQMNLLIPGKWAMIRVHYLEEEKPAQWIAQMEGEGAEAYLIDLEAQYRQKYEQMKKELKKKHGLNHVFQQKDFMGYTRAILAIEDEITYYLTQQLTEQA